MYKSIVLMIVVSILTACHAKVNKNLNEDAMKQKAFSLGDTVASIGKDIDCIFQDRDSIYWFASNGEGVFRYDGKAIVHLTTKDSLCSNFVWSIMQDVNGVLWFVTRDGVCCLEGNVFTNHTKTITHAPYGKLKYAKGGLFFGHAQGICYYDGRSFTNFNLKPNLFNPAASTTYNPYAMYCAVADRKGNVWFGTQEKGVCMYDGSNFLFIEGKHLNGPAVRCIFVDRQDKLWFGNNGGGLFCYKEGMLRNITEEKNLTNYEFLKNKMPVDLPGSLARVFAINEDDDGNLWIGTVDAGVWKYDGTKLTNYTTHDGLAGNSVYVIYKDLKGKLWFVANGEAIFNFDGQKFTKVTFD